MARQGPEARLITRMRRAGKDRYGKRLVQVKYHGSAMGEAGVHDLLGTLDGVFVSVEVKAPETYGGSVERAVEKGPTGPGRSCAASWRRRDASAWRPRRRSGPSSPPSPRRGRRT